MSEKLPLEGERDGNWCVLARRVLLGARSTPGRGPGAGQRSPSPVRPVPLPGIAQLGKQEKYLGFFPLLWIVKGVWCQGGQRGGGRWEPSVPGQAAGSAFPALSCCVKQGEEGGSACSPRHGTSCLLSVVKQTGVTSALSLSKG